MILSHTKQQFTSNFAIENNLNKCLVWLFWQGLDNENSALRDIELVRIRE